MTGGFGGLPLAEQGGNTSQWSGASRILGPAWARMPVLVVGLLGVQITWSAEMTYASPYLLSLGLTKSHMSLVFLAGPLSGLIVQPLVGVLADNSKSRFGRRRPYMVLGGAITVLAMLLLGFTRDFASIFTTRNSAANDALTVWLAVFSIYCIDFAINAVQAVDRALLVDTLPTSEQAEGNAWAAQMLGIGSVVGFFIGNIDLPYWFAWIGDTQLEVLSVIACFLLIFSHAITIVGVKEKVLLSTGAKGKGFKQELKEIYQNIRTLPPTIRQICMIQFFAWIGWFPVLFFLSTYIGEMHKRASPNATDAEGTRLGGRTQFYSAILSLFTNIALPFFVFTAETRTSSGNANGFYEVKKKGVKDRIPKVHLATLWAASHAIFAVCMIATWFVSSVWAATCIMTLTGFSWAITQWAPFSLIGEAILSGGSDYPTDGNSILLTDAREREVEERTRFLDGDENNDSDHDSDGEDRPRMGSRRTSRSGVMGSLAAQRSVVDVHGIGIDDNDDASTTGSHSGGGNDLASKAGIILGIHNIFIVIPQFLVTGLSSIIFAIFEPDKSVLHGHHPGKTIPGGANETAEALLPLDDRAWFIRDDAEDAEDPGVNSVAVIFRIGGLAALAAFALTYRLSRELKRVR